MPVKDFDQVASWAKESVKKVVRAGIMLGDDQGKFNPTAPITGQEIAVALDRFIQKMKP